MEIIDDHENYDVSAIDGEVFENAESPEKEVEPSDVPVLTNWITEEGVDAEVSFVEPESVEISAATDDGSGALRFFWLDAYEDMKNQQGMTALYVICLLYKIFIHLCRCRVSFR